MDRGICISWHVHLKSHIPGILHSQSSCSDPHSFILNRTGEFMELFYNPSYPCYHQLSYFAGCLPKHMRSYYTNFSINKNASSQSSHTIYACFYFAAIKHSTKLPWDRKGFILFQIHHWRMPGQQKMSGTQKQELRQRLYQNASYYIVSLSFISYLLTQPSFMCPEMAWLTVC